MLETCRIKRYSSRYCLNMLRMVSPHIFNWNIGLTNFYYFFTLHTDPDVFSLKTLWCLHSYLHPTSRFVRRDANGNKNIQRFTVKDSQESFLYVDLTIQGLEKHIESLLKRGESIQPFILAVGDSMFSSIEQCFVYLDGNLIAFDNFLRALDICFKSFHLFNLQYPKASDPFWTFIEAYFYDIDTGSKKSYKINTLLQELRD